MKDALERTPSGGSVGQNQTRRGFGIVVAALGAAGSVALLWRASGPFQAQEVLMWAWVLLPFVVLALAHVLEARWSRLTRWLLFGGTLVVVGGSLFVYQAALSTLIEFNVAVAFLFVPLGALVVVGALASLEICIALRGGRHRR